MITLRFKYKISHILLKLLHWATIVVHNNMLFTTKSKECKFCWYQKKWKTENENESKSG